MADALTLWLAAKAQANIPTALIAGGPPTFTGVLGQQVFDTKYGITWWCDGTTWHANGPGLIKAEMYRNAAFTPLGSGVVPYDTVASDPLSLITIATARFTCPIPGDYLVRASISIGSPTAVAYWSLQVNQNGAQGKQFGQTGDTTAFFAGTSGAARVTCAAGDYLQVWLVISTITAANVGDNLNWAQFEFFSS